MLPIHAEQDRIAAGIPKVKQTTTGLGAAQIQTTGFQQPVSLYRQARLRSIETQDLSLEGSTPEGVANGTSDYPA